MEGTVEDSEFGGNDIMDYDNGLSADIMDDILNMTDIRNVGEQDISQFLSGGDANNVQMDAAMTTDAGNEIQHGIQNEYNGNGESRLNMAENDFGDGDENCDAGGETSAACDEVGLSQDSTDIPPIERSVGTEKDTGCKES